MWWGVGYAYINYKIMPFLTMLEGWMGTQCLSNAYEFKNIHEFKVWLVPPSFFSCVVIHNNLYKCLESALGHLDLIRINYSIAKWKKDPLSPPPHTIIYWPVKLHPNFHLDPTAAKWCCDLFCKRFILEIYKQQSFFFAPALWNISARMAHGLCWRIAVGI